MALPFRSNLLKILLITIVFYGPFVYSQNTTNNCGTGQAVCHPNATCVYNQTSQNYNCVCNKYFAGDGSYCYYNFELMLSASPCSAGYLKCADGSCAPPGSIDNGKSDCPTAEDEDCMVSVHNKANSKIRCDGHCIPIGTVQNGTTCPKRTLTDKSYCTFFGHTIGVDSYACASGAVCIPMNWVNDSICSCPDCSDEPSLFTNGNCGPNIQCAPNASCVFSQNNRNFSCVCNYYFKGDGYNYCYYDFDSMLSAKPCSVGSLKCADGACVSPGSIDNGKADCTNGEDELCYVSQLNKNGGKIKCDGKCVALNTIQNSTLCPNKVLTDKMYCTFFGHQVGNDSFMCHSNTACIPMNWVNDSICSCPDCSDEPPKANTTHGCGPSGTVCHTNATCSYNQTNQIYTCQCKEHFLGDGVDYCYYDHMSMISAPPCGPAYLKCLDGTCAQPGSINNMKRDCSSGEDEDCFVSIRNRNNSKISCDGKCYPVSKIHNKVLCPNRILMNKMYCTFFGHKIGIDAFMCDTGDVCIPQEWVGDGICSCSDCSDEMSVT